MRRYVLVECIVSTIKISVFSWKHALWFNWLLLINGNFRSCPNHWNISLTDSDSHMLTREFHLKFCRKWLMDLGLSILRMTCRQGDLGSLGLINFKIIRHLVSFLLYFCYDFSFFFVLGLLQDLLLSRIKKLNSPHQKDWCPPKFSEKKQQTNKITSYKDNVSNN